MRHVSTLISTAILALTVNTVLVAPAFAYVDPGTGTMLLQAAGAMIAAGLFYLRNIRQWIGRHLGLGKGAAPAAGKSPDDTTQD